MKPIEIPTVTATDFDPIFTTVIDNGIRIEDGSFVGIITELGKVLGVTCFRGACLDLYQMDVIKSGRLSANYEYKWVHLTTTRNPELIASYLAKFPKDGEGI